MNKLTAQHATYVADTVEYLTSTRPEHGSLDGEHVLAMDILMHALKFCDVPDGLAMWREALWHRTLREPAKQAIVFMLNHITTAIARGELDAAGKICNCLNAVTDPTVFRLVSAQRAASMKEASRS
jgi:hypothetical protein